MVGSELLRDVSLAAIVTLLVLGALSMPILALLGFIGQSALSATVLPHPPSFPRSSRASNLPTPIAGWNWREVPPIPLAQHLAGHSSGGRAYPLPM